MSAVAKTTAAVAVLALAGVAAFSFDAARNPGSIGSHTVGPHTVGMSTAVAAPDDGTPINACALLSDEEVSAAVGAKVTPAERRDDGEVGGQGKYAPAGTYSSTCFWQFHADASGKDDPTLPMGGKRFAILNAMVWPTKEDAASFLQSFRDAFKEDIIPNDPIPLKGIGDEGLWWGDGTAVRKSNKSFGMSVFLQNGDKASQRKMEESLARKIEGRIK